MKAKDAIENTEAMRLADQLRRAFDGPAWHGPGLMEILEDVDAESAAAKPLSKVHSIWELLLHVAAWDDAGLRRLKGEKFQPTGPRNFPPISTATEGAWRATVGRVRRMHDELVNAVGALPESRLRDRVPGKRYDFYHMLHGIAQHELYHAGQIAILKKAARANLRG